MTNWEIVIIIQVRKDDDLSKMVVLEVVRREWVMYIFLKAEQVGFANKLDDGYVGKERN